MPRLSDLLRYIVWLGLIAIAALLIGVVVARVLKRRLQAEPRTQGFSLDDLRRMRAEGGITQQEYEAMRAALIGQLGAGSSAASARSPGARPTPDRGAEAHGRSDSAADG